MGLVKVGVRSRWRSGERIDAPLMRTDIVPRLGE